MNFSPTAQFSRWFIIISSFIITALILWNVAIFFEQLKDAERSKMEIYAAATRAFQETSEVDPSPKDPNARVLSNVLTSLQLRIIEENKTIPILQYNLESRTYTPSNIRNGNDYSQEELAAMAKEFAATNEPITIGFDGVDIDIMYFGNSPVISQLKYFPIALLVILMLFVALIYFYYLTSKASSQNLLWAGMAKETAHQIGTPLSSLVGWTEILKMEMVNPEYLVEMNKDINRLEVITDRFSKIGSVPDLERVDINDETYNAYEYLSKRSAKNIHITIELPDEPLHVWMNSQLYGWTIENLVKNAIDAMKGKGDLEIEITSDKKYARVSITDSGKGIPKSKFNRIFEPGFTTKKRGWGLGLSLAKRIIEEYHQGSIKVLRSELGKGTTFQILLKLAR